MTHTNPGAIEAYLTLRAERRDRSANSLTKGNEIAVQLLPVSDGQYLPQGKFGLERGLGSHQPPSIGYPVDMGIHTDPLLIVTMCDYEVGGFSSDAFQLQ
jgi:hypothetical protein